MYATAWITGASHGIGRALALRLAGEGTSVAVSARSAEALEALAAEAGSRPGQCRPVPVDVSDLEAMREAARRIESEVGAPDLAVFAAGTSQTMHANDFSAETASKIMAVNYGGAVNGLDAILPAFRARGSGRLGIVASVAGYRGFPGLAAYGPSKAALINLCESLHGELKRGGIRLSVINPGLVKTRLTEGAGPTPFAITPERAAKEILRGLKTDCFEIIVPREAAPQFVAGRVMPNPVYLRVADVLSRFRPT